MTCQRSGCSNPTKGPRARFCSGACKVAHHRKAKKPLGLIEEPPDAALASLEVMMGSDGSETMVRKDARGKVVPWSGKTLKANPAIANTGGPMKDGNGVVIIDEIAAGMTRKELIHETCPPDCPNKDDGKHLHVSMPGFASIGAGTPKGERISMKPHVFTATPAVKAALDRSHAPGCPCWTCKGVPDNKPKPKK